MKALGPSGPEDGNCVGLGQILVTTSYLGRMQYSHRLIFWGSKYMVRVGPLMVGWSYQPPDRQQLHR